MKEIWKPLKGYEARYMVSNYGNLKSLDFIDSKKRLRKGKLIKLQKDQYGYLRARLSYNSTKFTVRLHRLVAEHFIENTKNKPQVNHKDGNKENNKVSNLEWCTNQENQIHAIQEGLRVDSFGVQARRYDSDVLVYDLNMNFLYKLQGNEDMKNHGFDYRLISAVVHGKRKHHKQHIFTRYLIPLL